MAKQRILNTATLNAAARDYAGQFLLPSRFSQRSPAVATAGREWVLQSFYNAHFKDEFEYLLPRFKAQLGPDAVADFERAAAERYPDFGKRRDDVFERELAERLAIRPDGTFIPGKLGSVKIGQRIVGTRPVTLRTHKGERLFHMVEKQPVFAGDAEWMGSMGAASLTMAAVVAIAMLDAMVDYIDIGSTAGVLSGISGSRPADPDAALTGTQLFQCTFSDPAFAASVDDTDGTVSSTAAAITDDSSADATGTATHLRISATGTGADDLIDGNIGTAGEDLNLNTVSIVSGATVAISSYVMNLSQGSGAT